ncbi:MAG: hypothetical protein LBD35_02020, partial [Prevotellaceae bacterium]|nr:hypothetical protein [Prevotellaceae bacterium]
CEERRLPVLIRNLQRPCAKDAKPLRPLRSLCALCGKKTPPCGEKTVNLSRNTYIIPAEPKIKITFAALFQWLANPDCRATEQSGDAERERRIPVVGSECVFVFGIKSK